MLNVLQDQKLDSLKENKEKENQFSNEFIFWSCQFARLKISLLKHNNNNSNNNEPIFCKFKYGFFFKSFNLFFEFIRQKNGLFKKRRNIFKFIFLSISPFLDLANSDFLLFWIFKTKKWIPWKKEKKKSMFWTWKNGAWVKRWWKGGKLIRRRRPPSLALPQPSS